MSISALHAGAADPGGSGWRYGDHVAGRELGHLILAFNGRFKSRGRGRVLLVWPHRGPLRRDGSIVTYRDGNTDIGAWRRGSRLAAGRSRRSVRTRASWSPGAGRPRQPNRVARRAGAPRSAAPAWWPAAGGNPEERPADLGAVGSDRQPTGHGDGRGGVQRGIELDINPDWVAGYLYVHHRHAGLDAVPVVPGQFGIAGHLRALQSRLLHRSLQLTRRGPAQARQPQAAPSRAG